MVARIKSGTSIKGALNYNEHKVREGKAVLIAAPRFFKEAAHLTFHDKLLRLQKRAQLNERVRTNCLHLSLNFHLSDKLNGESLEKIAAAYMEGIGFGQQPYLVYQHLDAHHTHLHIVTTNIQKDGSRISLHNLGRSLSESTRKQLEKDFGLVRAEGQVAGLGADQPLEKLLYGKAPTKQALSRVVSAVAQQYAFASLPEFNAVLRCYGVTAYRRESGSPMFANKGLLYSILDEKGNRIGVPIKASALYGKPTLSTLEGLFDKGVLRKKALKKELAAQLQPFFLYASFFQIENALKKKGIDTICQHNGQGFLYGVTYVDHRRKVVFKGSELGKTFSAAALREALGRSKNQQPEPGHQVALPDLVMGKEGLNSPQPIDISLETATSISQWLQPEEEPAYVPYPLRKKRRQQKRKLT